MNAEPTDREKGLPRMGADDRGLGKTIKPVEWRPPAEVFRMDTREGREAYEASFRMKIKPGEGIPAKAENERFSVERLDTATKSETVSGSFGAPSLALPLRLAQEDKGTGSIAQTHANLG